MFPCMSTMPPLLDNMNFPKTIWLRIIHGVIDAISARKTTAVDFRKVFMLLEKITRKMRGRNMNCGFVRVAKPHERPARIKNPTRPEARMNSTAPRRNKFFLILETKYQKQHRELRIT